MSIYQINLITSRNPLSFYHLANCVDEKLGVRLEVFDVRELLFVFKVGFDAFFAKAVICTSVDKKNFHDVNLIN